MTTAYTSVMQLRNARFNNPALPVLGPIIAPGLRAAFRPRADISSMADLSGNGTLTTKVGSPVFTDTGVIGTVANGFTTNLAETKNHTYIVTAKCTAATTPFIVGNFNSTAELGTGLFALSTAGNMTSSAAYWTKSGATTNWDRINGPAVSIAMFPTLWSFMVITVDSDRNRITFWLKQGSAELTKIGPVSNSGLSTRNMAPAETLRIMGPQPAWAYTGQAEVAELLIYDRVLTDDEIIRQYGYSKPWLASRGVQL